ncbi:MAG: autotransporter assembly complex family protein [Alphaproteobacteria bacterium]
MIRFAEARWAIVTFCISLVTSLALLAIAPGWAPGWAAGWAAGPAGAEPAGTSDALTYRMTIEGITDEALLERLRETSRLVAFQDTPPLTSGGLRRRAREDQELFEAVLRADGYYASRIDFSIREDRQPVDVIFRIEPGPVYRLEDYTVAFSPPLAEDIQATLDLDTVIPALDTPARAAPIADARRRLPRRLAGKGYPFAEITDHKVVVDHTQEAMSVEVEVSTGARARFGPLTITGLADVSEDYIRRLTPWQAGDIYDQDKVDNFRQTLAETNLFQGVSIEAAEALSADGMLPLQMRVVERARRSVGFGAKFSTDVGASVSASWKHRNLFGAAERSTAAAEIGEITQSLSLDFTKPHFRMQGQDLFASLALNREDDDAFDERSLAAAIGLDRALAWGWRLRAGPTFEILELTDTAGEKETFLTGFPLSFSRDDTDNLLDPTQGNRLGFRVSPFFGTLDETTSFLVTEANGSHYLSLDPEDGVVLASRLRLGTIVGESRAAVPANKRFYAGGGGSVRGFEFRRVGPLDATNDPLGGRSVIELGLETRIRITESIGAVPFLDGGNVFRDPIPDDPARLRWAAGLGLRYFTPFGPLRFDLAFPIDRRDGVDDLFQFYLSVGQSF